MSTISPICPTGCSSILPETSFDLCNPNVSWGEIQRVFVGMADANPFGSGEWTDHTLWETALALAATETNAIRQLYVSGDLPNATSDETVISLGRKIYSPASHTINIDIDDLSAENYEFMRTLGCNLQFRVWFFTQDYMYGGQDGLLAMFNLRPVIERGIKSLNKLSGTITWEDKFSAERAISIYSSITIPTVIAPALVSAEAYFTTALIIDFDVDMADPSAHLGDFTVKVNGSPIVLLNVSLNPVLLSQMVLNTVTPMNGIDVVTLSIASGDVKSAAGGVLSTVTDYACSNTMAISSPYVVSSLAHAVNSIVIHFDVDMQDPAAFLSDFTVKANGDSLVLNFVSLNVPFPYEVILETITPMLSTDNLTLSIASGNIKSVADDLMQEVINFPINNTI